MQIFTVEKIGVRGPHIAQGPTVLTYILPALWHSCSFVSDSLWPHGLQPTRLLCPWDFPGKSTGKWSCSVMSNSLRPSGLALQPPLSMGFSRQQYWSGLPFPSPKVKWKVTHATHMDYTDHEILQVRILDWVAIPFSRGSSQPRDQTQVSCIAGGFFTSWATREAQEYWGGLLFPPPENLPYPGIEPASVMSPALASLLLVPSGKSIYIHGGLVTKSCLTLATP